MRLENIKLSICLAVLFSFLQGYSFGEGLPFVKYVDCPDIGSERPVFVKIAQFQIDIPLGTDTISGLPAVESGKEYYDKISRCLTIAAKHNARVVIFPELTSALPAGEREEFMALFRTFAEKNEAIVVAGTFYTKERRCVCPVIFPDTVYYSYKIRPSIFESSVYGGKGMVGTDTLCVYRSRYGNFVPLVCVDLISDDANYMVRRLSNKGEVDLLVSVCYNPASLEFLREASSMVTRHPLYTVIANVATGPGASSERAQDAAYGYSGVVGVVHNMQKEALVARLPAVFKSADGHGLHEAYENVAAVAEPGEEVMLTYEINLSVKRLPMLTNAPDQGYPAIRNMARIDLGRITDK